MPPITRNQFKKSNLKNEPYSKENRLAERRTALLDLVENNGIKKIISTNNVEAVVKSKEIISKNDNITKNISTSIQPKNEVFKPIVTKKVSNLKETERLSLNNSNDTTLYQSATDNLNETEHFEKSEELYTTAADNSNSLEINHSELYHSAVQELCIVSKEKEEEEEEEEEEEIFEIDKTNWNNFMYVGCYARDIFKYLRQREALYSVTDYISDQSEITPRHRAIVVNWFVNLQEMYGLNHEVLYMAVKLIDLYLMKNQIAKDKFQLLASGAILLSSKIDEREPGFPYDLVKQSKFIYTEDELFFTERELARSLNYDLNIPLSYIFLRRFARCMKCQMVLLTLARYILECSLLDYNFVTSKDSLIAAASLYLAFKMCHKPIDTKEFHKYTGYDVREIKDTVMSLNNTLHTQSSDLSAVKQKYSNEVFYEVACKPLLSNSKLTFA